MVSTGCSSIVDLFMEITSIQYSYLDFIQIVSRNRLYHFLVTFSPDIFSYISIADDNHFNYYSTNNEWKTIYDCRRWMGLCILFLMMYIIFMIPIELFLLWYKSEFQLETAPTCLPKNQDTKMNMACFWFVKFQQWNAAKRNFEFRWIH